jgi:hypothetical protein
MSFILQKLFQERMESYADALPSINEDALLLSQIESIKTNGFSEDEFKKAKQQLIDQMESFYSKKTAGEDSVASLLSFRNSAEKIQLADLSSHLASFLKEDPRTLRILGPVHAEARSENPEKTWQRDWMFDTADALSIRFADNLLNEGPIFFIDNPSVQIEPFYQLPLEEKEQKLIQELVKTIAEKNVWGLLFKKRELEKIGKKVNIVHPMRFMGYILSHERLKKCLREIRHSSFKWDHFIDGFADRMKEEGAKNNLIQYVPGMAHLLHVDHNQILDFIHNKDYEGLVKSLL